MKSPHTLCLTNATAPSGERVDIHIEGDRIGSLTPPGTGAITADRTIDLGGALVGPAFVDGHIHLDKTLLGEAWVPHRAAGSLPERVAHEQAIQGKLERPAFDRAIALVEQIVASGTGHARAHVDIDPTLGLRNLEMVLAVRERCRPLLDLQIVAFPQSGVLRAPGTAGLLDAALRAGASVVGGLDPATADRDIEGQLDVLFSLAERHTAGIDIHLHDPGTLGTFQLQRIAERSAALSMHGRVAVSHAFCLGAVDDLELGRTADALAAGGVAIMTNAPGGDPMPPVQALRDHGVTVFAGSDNIRDAWWPFGNGDMLERAMMIAYRQLFTDEGLRIAYDMATIAAATALELDDYALAPGARANLVAIDAPLVPEAVATYPPRRLVLHDGRVVAENGALTQPAVD